MKSLYKPVLILTAQLSLTLDKCSASLQQSLWAFLFSPTLCLSQRLT